MDITTLKSFLMWCTIINGGLFLFWSVIVLLAPDRVYRTQRAWIPISKETFDVAMYAFLGAFKLVFLFFNLVPLLALMIIA